VGFAYAGILVSPFVAGTTIAVLRPARHFVARQQRTCAAVGWTAFTLVLPAAVLLHGARHILALALLCPLTALTWWRPSDDSDGDDGGDDDLDPLLPGPPGIDWDRFMRDLDEYSSSRTA
jgi:hypothetical protein